MGFIPFIFRSLLSFSTGGDRRQNIGDLNFYGWNCGFLIFAVLPLCCKSSPSRWCCGPTLLFLLGMLCNSCTCPPTQMMTWPGNTADITFYFVLTSYILSLVELLDLFWFLVYNGDAKGLLWVKLHPCIDGFLMV